MSERPKNQSPIAWKPKAVNVLILESLFVKYGQSLNVNTGRSGKNHTAGEPEIGPRQASKIELMSLE